MDVQAVLFDFDFTLTDPSVWLIPAWADGLGAIEEPPRDTATLKGVVGRPLKAQYSTIVGEPPSGVRFEKFERCYCRYRDQHAPAETIILPGVAATLEALTRAGIVLGIVSTGALQRLNAILTRTALDRYFRIVEAASRDKASAIAAVIDALGVETAGTVYVGDHPEDCRAASQAQVRFAAVRTGVHNVQDFPDGTIVLDSVADLPVQLLATNCLPPKTGGVAGTSERH